MKGVNMARTDLSGANLSPLKFKMGDGSIRSQIVNLEGANLRYALLEDTNLSEVNFAGADLSYAVIKNCNVTNTNFAGAKLDDIEITDTEMGAAKTS